MTADRADQESPTGERARDYRPPSISTLKVSRRRIRPRPAQLIRQRASAYEDLHQYDRAEADYNAALAIEPLDPDFYAKRGFYFIRRGRYDEALADFRTGGELVPGDGGFPYGEGQTYGKLGQHDKAVERYTEAIRRNASVTNYYRERGSAYNYLGKFQEALAITTRRQARLFVPVPRARRLFQSRPRLRVAAS